MLENILYRTKIRFLMSVIIGLAISRTRFRFDTSYRHGETKWKERFYILCSTVAANYIADGGWKQIKHWAKYV